MDSALRPSAAAWKERFTLAADRLNDAAWMLRVRDSLRAGQERGDKVVYLESGRQMRRLVRVGVFTGSFNPLTWAHVAVAETARNTLRLDALVWACSRVTVDKESVERATLLDRTAQVDTLVLAERYADNVAVVDAGLYVAQARAFRETLRADVHLTLIVGYDKLVQILDPRYYDDRDARLAELFALAELSVAPRAGADEGAMADLLREPANRPFAGAIHYLPVPPEVAVLSSTLARARAADCDEPHALALASITPPEGAALACSTGAYRVSQGADEPRRDDANGDAYTWRHVWLDALHQGDWLRGERVDIRMLVARTQERSERGAQARRWLRGERWPGAPASTEALARMLMQ